MAIKLIKLNVNLNIPTADALREIADYKGLTFTETVRRCISIYKYLVEEEKAGRVIVTMDKDEKNAKELILL